MLMWLGCGFSFVIYYEEWICTLDIECIHKFMNAENSINACIQATQAQAAEAGLMLHKLASSWLRGEASMDSYCLRAG